MFFFGRLIQLKKKIITPRTNCEFGVFLTNVLGFTPTDVEKYKEAFIHRSAQIKDTEGNNVNFERLEFLGDAVLGLMVAMYLFQESPEEKEGYLTKMRSKIVSRNQLNRIGKEMNLISRLQPENTKNLGDDINGDLVEALIGAVYLDKGYIKASKFINDKIINAFVDLNKLERTITSHKSLILEWGQKSKNNLKFNTFKEENAEDLIIFVSVIRLNEKVIAKGRGTSKKRAEENAAKRAYYFLQNKMENVV